MLDKNCISFLKYLLRMGDLTFYEMYNFFSKNKIEHELAKNYCTYLFKEGYIKLARKKFIIPTFKTKLAIDYFKKSKVNSFFITHILPYIQQFIIFILGLLAPYLLKFLKQIFRNILSY